MDRDGVICRGRESELDRAANLLDVAESGTDGVILIRGVPGMGKTVLLRKIIELAGRKGFTIMEFSGIDAPAGQHPSVTLSARRSSSVTIEVPDIRQLQLHIEAQTVHGPVLVVGDDMHRARQCDVRALLLLLERLGGRPVVWVLACQATASMAELARRITAGRVSVCLLELDPLPEEAVADLVEHLAGGKPGPDLMELVDWAGGDPGLVTDLIAGLLAEHALEAADGVARMLSAKLPRQVVRTAQRRLDELSDRCRQFVTVAAALGRTVAFDDVAAVLDESPANLLLQLEEAIRAGLLASRTGAITFASDLLWRTVSEAIPRTVASALRQRARRSPTTASPSPEATRTLSFADRRGERLDLTEIEREIVELVSRGLTNVQIAHRLVRSEHTVNYHLQKIYRRLNVHSRTELIGLLQQRAI